MTLQKTTLISTLLLATSAASAGECKFREELDFGLSAAGLSELDLKAGAGSLVIEGHDRDDAVVVTATACASSQKRLDGLKLSHRVAGDQLKVLAEQTGKDWNWSGNAYGYMNLSISLPSRLAVRVTDGSGHATISGVAAAYIDDGSGGLELLDIGGDVELEDGSGNVQIRDVAGSVVVRDGSGNLDIARVRGSVLVEDDGSGSIDINDVTFDVRIEDDGSGSIQIADVGGSVEIGDDGSGAIKVRDVGGDFRVDDDSNGGIQYRNVKGSVQIPQPRRRSR